jgi:hypothetical protein
MRQPPFGTSSSASFAIRINEWQEMSIAMRSHPASSRRAGRADPRAARRRSRAEVEPAPPLADRFEHLGSLEISPVELD